MLLSLLPVCIVAAFSLVNFREYIIGLVSSHIEAVADDKVNLLERWVRERQADVRVMASSPVLRSLDRPAIASYLEAVRKNYEVYRDLAVVSRDRHAIYGEAAAAEFMAEPWFDGVMAGDFHQSGIYLEPGMPESVFTLAAPILDPEGRSLGVVVAKVGTQAILSMVIKVALGQTGECYLVDTRGTFLAHNDPKKILVQNIARSGSFKNIFGDERKGGTYTDYRGIAVLGASRRVPGTEWFLVVEQDRDEAFAGLYRLRRYIYAATLCSVAGALALAWLFASYVVGPIQRLGEAAEALRRGEFRPEMVATERSDELGALYAAFGGMARQLEAHRNRLERTVDQRDAELKEADEKLKITAEAAARSQRLAALGRLAAGVTHEIRTPLASLKLFLQSAREEIEISPEYEDDYRIAMDQVLRIEATINRFLDFARPREPILTPVAIEPLIREALLVVHPRANQQEVLIATEIASGLPPVRGDRRQLSEALLNLMVNALDAMNKGDTLSILASPGEREFRGRLGRCVRIDVRDTGSGIAPENLPKLFDPFFTTRQSGTGLGLSIVYATVASHGGEVTVASAPGRGATFTVFLPAGTESGMGT
jgi:signal transduction histidine kinase